MVLEALLADLGPELVSARSGEEALRRLLEHEYAVILLDVQMPGLDGFETARLIRERERDSATPIIFLTANYLDFAHVMRGYAVGAVDYMLKPIAADILKSKVHVFLELYRRTEEVRRQAEQLRQLEKRAHEHELALERVRKAELSDQLRQAQKMEAVGNLAGGIAHDFNNLLTVIQGYSSFLMSGLKSDDPMREHAQAIQEAASQAGWLTRQLLTFSRKAVVQPRVVDLNAIAETTEKMLRRVIGEHIQLVTHLARDLGRVNADPAQLEQVLMNLAVNARDAMKNGGRLVIRTLNATVDGADERGTLKPGDYTVLEVTDTGQGMDEATQARIFEPFFTTKEVGKGTGLGLATVYGIVQQSGGHIDVQSAPGRGTTFRVWLPRVQEPVEEPRLVAPRSTPGRGTGVVLLAEDERPVRMLARRVLEQAGYRVLEASSGEKAIELCDGHPGPINLLLTDMVMPGMNGRELAHAVLERRPEIQVLFMSGYMDDIAGVLTPEERETRFLEKPFSPEAMVRKVRELVEMASLCSYDGVGSPGVIIPKERAP